MHSQGKQSLARQYIWWPYIDNGIETLIKSCESCQLNRNEPEKHNSHYWEYPDGPWQRIHADLRCASRHKNHFFNIIAIIEFEILLFGQNCLI